MANGVVNAIVVVLALGAAGYIVLKGLPTDEVRKQPQQPAPPETVVYSHVDGQDLSMDIYRPPKHVLGAVLLLHGGGWVGGGRGQMAELAERAARLGFVAASADYRLAPKNRWPAQLQDVQTAVRYLRANADLLHFDQDNIAAVGVSAGGQLSLFLGSVDDSNPKVYGGRSSQVGVVGSISGIHDLRLKLTPEGERYRIIEALTGSRQGAAVAAASPILVTSKKTAPTYFIQGSADPLVPPNQTAEAAKHLAKLGVPEKAVTVPGMGHGLTLGVKNQSDALDDMLLWIYDHLPHRRGFD